MKFKKHLLGFGLFLLVVSAAYSQSTGTFDKYAGWTKINGKATGFFTVQQVDGRWWFITPEGNGFIAMGLNHIRSVGFPQQPGKEREAYNKTVLEDLQLWGFNNLGYSAPEELKGKIPYIQEFQFAQISNWLPAERVSFPDVFTEEFAKHVDVIVKEICQSIKDDPYLIGYYSTDVPFWSVEFGQHRAQKDWIAEIRSLDRNSPGKQAYISFLEQKYGRFIDFDGVYRVSQSDRSIDSFEKLLDFRFDDEVMNGYYRTMVWINQDNHEFLGRIAERYFSLTTGTIKKYDPNHLILGDRFEWLSTYEAVLKVAAQYIDVCSIQLFGFDNIPIKVIEYYYEITNKPVIICDFPVSKNYPEFDYVTDPVFDTWDLAGQFYNRFVKEGLVGTDYIIGFQKCQYLDLVRPYTYYKTGIKDRESKVHEGLEKHLIETNKNIYQYTDE